MSDNLRDLVLNRPLMIEETYGEKLAVQAMSDPQAFFSLDRQHESANYQVFGGVAVIPVMGFLVHRGRFMSRMITSYQAVAGAVTEAAEDDSVHTILLDIDSGGGMVEGVFDLAEYIADVSENIKPVHAIANGAAFSAAYAIAVSADQLFVTRTGGVGSIGVITEHIDISGMLGEAGIKVTPIFAGKLKNERSPDFPISEAAVGRIQAEINDIYDMFVEHVGALNPLLTAEGARNTEAGLFFGKNAVESGLANQVMNFDEVINFILDAENESVTNMSGSINAGKVNEMKIFGQDKSKDVKAQEGEDKAEDENLTPAGADETEAPKAESDEGAEDAADEDKADCGECAGDEDKAEDHEDAEAAAEAEAEDPNQIAAKIVEMAVEAGTPAKAAELIKRGVSLEQAKSELDKAGQIATMCKIAGQSKLAAGYIEAGLSVKEVGDKLVALQEKEDDKTAVSNKPDVKAIEKAAASGYANQDSDESNALLADADRRAKAAK